MTIVKELAAALAGMFFAEKWLAAALLALVAATGMLVDFAGVYRLLGGVILLFGSVILLVASVCRGARVRSP